jgi:hypothetical protein
MYCITCVILPVECQICTEYYAERQKDRQERKKAGIAKEGGQGAHGDHQDADVNEEEIGSEGG